MTHGAFTPPHDAGWYEIRIQGRLDPRWSTYFDGVHVTHDGAGTTTTLCGNVVDQAALHGLLARLRDIGLPLISVTRIGPDPAELPHRDHHDPIGD